MLITFEGGEGSGKSTQMKVLAERLTAAGYQVLTLREPGGTPIGEAIRHVVLDSKYKEMAFATEVFLFQAQRSQLYEQVILPALKNKKIVLIDRSRDSSVVYQGMVRRFGKELIEELNTISTHNTYPDMTFLLDVTVEIGLSRRAGAGQENRLDKEKFAFHEQVRESYLALAKENQKKRWHIVDADQLPAQVTEQIWQIIVKKMPQASIDKN